MNARRKRIERAFVVRVWREIGATQADPLRGGVQDLATGERFYFGDLGDLNVYLRSRMEPSALRRRPEGEGDDAG